jgi:hypothetical protein
MDLAAECSKLRSFGHVALKESQMARGFAVVDGGKRDGGRSGGNARSGGNRNRGHNGSEGSGSEGSEGESGSERGSDGGMDEGTAVQLPWLRSIDSNTLTKGLSMVGGVDDDGGEDGLGEERNAEEVRRDRAVVESESESESDEISSSPSQ